jgi:hypothetical protein
LYYRSKTGYAFDAAVLDDVRAFEKKLVGLPSYSKHCLALKRSSKACRGLVSPTRFFHGTVTEANPTSSGIEANVKMYVVPDGKSEKRLPIEPLIRKLGEEQVWKGISGRQARDWYFDAKFPDSQTMRARSWFGLPFAGFDSHLADVEAQKEVYLDFIDNELLPMLEEASTDNVEIFYMGPVLTDHEVFLSVRQDTYWSIGSIIFVWVYMSVHLRAPHLAFLGMGIVALSFPMGLVVFRMFGNEQMAIINFLALFLLIGIGADNIFILTDLWRQARLTSTNATEQLQRTMSKAGKAVTVCGITTACSFLANGASAVKPVREFGIFVGICVLSNLLLCLTLYPPVLVLFERTKKKDLSDEKKARQQLGMAPASDPDSTETPGPALMLPGPAGMPRPQAASQPDQERNPISASEKDVSKEAGYLPSEIFLYHTFAPKLMKFRFCIIAVGFVCTILFMFLTATSLKVSREPPQFFAPGDHNLGDVFEMRNEFTNETLWVPAMEGLPVRICEGCPFMDEASGSLQSGCTFVGALCDKTPCQTQSGWAQCSGRGTCNQETGSCNCPPDWAGADCSAPRYVTRPSDCGDAFSECSGHGICKEAPCWCDLGWTGSQCADKGSSNPGFKAPAPPPGTSPSPPPPPTDQAAVQCEWGNWGDWDTCSKTCGFGAQRRSRKVQKSQENANCDSLRGSGLDERGCKVIDCPVDCVWNDWSEWTGCDVECGSGKKQSSRDIQIAPRGQGKSCVGQPTKTEACEMTPCEEVCGVTNWTNAGPCSTSCGPGQQLQNRTIANKTSVGCPTKTEQSIPCLDNPVCPETCELDPWKNQGECSATCGIGTITQTRDIASGTDCPAEDSNERYRTTECRSIICDDPCSNEKYSAWSAWSTCDQPCGVGIKQRTRTAPDGCPNAPEKDECQIQTCAARCESFAWQQTSGCSATCGSGVVIEVRDFGDESPGDCPATRERSCDTGTVCPQNCVLSGWEATTACSATCGYGNREENKKILMEGSNGGDTCPNANSPSRKRTARCKIADCPGSDLPKSEVSYDVVLHGKDGSMSATEEYEMRKHIANFLGVDISDVTLVEVKSRRLGAPSRRMQDGLTVRVVVEASANRHEDMKVKFSQAVNSGRLHSKLQDGPGFDDVHGVEIVEQPAPSPPPSGSSPSPAPAKQPSQATLPDSLVAVVSIVFGINPDEPIDRSKSMGQGLAKGSPVYVDEFNFNDPNAQMAIWQLCNASRTDPMWEGKNLALRKPRCLMEDFNLWLRGRGFKGLPIVPGSVSGEALNSFLSDSKGKKWVKHAGFDYEDANKVRWIRADFLTNLPAKMAATDVWPWLERWNDQLTHWNSGTYPTVPNGLRHAYHTSQLWVRAETELRLVKSTLTCAVISIVCALVAILIFTGNVALAIYLVSVILCIVICLAGLMFGVLGWSFGAVEAIGLIVFVGFSVDYSLHMVEAYNQSAYSSRFARAREALLQTGSAVFSAGVTSLGAGGFILCCTINVFVQFGMVVIFNTILSLLFSLFFLCALLMVIGPTDNFGSVPAFFAWITGKQVGEPQSGDNAVTGHVVGLHGVPPGNIDGPGAPTEYVWRDYDEDPDLKKQKEKAAAPTAAGTAPAAAPAPAATAAATGNPTVDTAAPAQSPASATVVRAVTTPPRRESGSGPLMSPTVLGAGQGEQTSGGL